ncbi:general secretion pathway protein GspB [Algiphilus sp. W345]|uniref:General secretion pathway protein GspB n=1 Tax=Banduia mediterranea TaxID=3075609 RepID=A0ABU2WMD4_9GAMM|nr:general secretion pathway protein GspB [Algiphilus sp. W345]MDT0498700.1 general secretion pathway protein GspB [Algiphilus sp. W345]
MSVILDALRRAEQERKLGQAPSVQVITQMPGQAPLEQRAPVAVWLLLAAVVVAIAALAIWLLWRPAPSTSPTPAAVVDAAAPDITQTAPPPKRREGPAPVSPTPVPETPRVIRDARGLNDLDDFLPAPRPPARSAAPVISAPPATPPAPMLAPQDTRQGELPPPSGPIDRSDVAPPSADELRVVPSAATAPSPYPALRDMSPNYRSDFPSFSVDVHVYNDDPAKRWTMIELRKYLEGQTIEAGPRIVEIRRDGIVFNWKGEIVLYPTNR